MEITDLKPNLNINSLSPKSRTRDFSPNAGIESRMSGINTNLSSLFGVAIFGETLFGEEYYFTTENVIPSSIIKNIKPLCQ
jgi:hypothetical protein